MVSITIHIDEQESGNSVVAVGAKDMATHFLKKAGISASKVVIQEKTKEDIENFKKEKGYWYSDEWVSPNYIGIHQ